MCVLPVKYAVNIYQTLPKAGTIPKPPCHREVQTPTKCYQDLCSRSETLWHFRFGLPTLTNLQDLSLNLPCVTFTKHYHRGGGQGIKPNAPSRVGEYRHSGCHMGSMVKGYRSRSPSEPLGVVARWVVGVTKKKFSRLVMVA